jgi:hypothetical protein
LFFKSAILKKTFASSSSIILACEPFDETLETLSKNSLDFETAKDILNQTTAGLLNYHSNNLVHGDITSSQIAIFNNSDNKIAKICKFPVHGKANAIFISLCNLTRTFIHLIWHFKIFVKLLIIHERKRVVLQLIDMLSLSISFTYSLINFMVVNINYSYSSVSIIDKTGSPSMPNDIRMMGHIYRDLFKRVGDVPPLCHHLIQSMIGTRDERVLPCEAVFYHPLFWSPGEVTDFLLVVGDFYKDNPTIDRNSNLESNRNGKLTQEFQHLKTNRSAIEYFLSYVRFILFPIVLNEDNFSLFESHLISKMIFIYKYGHDYNQKKICTVCLVYSSFILLLLSI